MFQKFTVTGNHPVAVKLLSLEYNLTLELTLMTNITLSGIDENTIS
jgi:hypothetical protein